MEPDTEKYKRRSKNIEQKALRFLQNIAFKPAITLQRTPTCINVSYIMLLILDYLLTPPFFKEI